MGEEKKYPKHIGIILDGNRRFARRLMMEPWKGHELGFEKLKQLYKWCKELGIKELTLYCFSMQNFNRPKREFDFLMDIFVKAGNDAAANEDVHKNKIRVNAIGRWHLFPEKVQEAIKKAVDATKDYNDFTVNLCLAYGGREEIVDGVKKLAADLKDGKINADDINEEKFSEYLYMNSEPDLIIRTGGAHRTSNFLAWQSIYSEWIFPEKFWPEFEKKDLIDCIDKFMGRERRFGK
ncbi:di-trans,poly-cis-decaprenylcistransferase [Candidatus Woesearchaeota archaeon]|nr:di-trans,poly-cis-decaprenylcistransferase [Candidatus Woesearchaeota archaeon]